MAAIAIWSYREMLDRYWRADRLLKRFGFGCPLDWVKGECGAERAEERI